MEIKRCIGHYWVVWDKIVGEFVSFDDSSNPQIVHENNMCKLNVDVEEAWERIREENNYPNKGPEYYPQGNVMFDETKCKFTVTGPPKLTNDSSFQRKIIKVCGLNQWTIFVKE